MDSAFNWPEKNLPFSSVYLREQWLIERTFFEIACRGEIKT